MLPTLAAITGLVAAGTFPPGDATLIAQEFHNGTIRTFATTVVQPSSSSPAAVVINPEDCTSISPGMVLSCSDGEWIVEPIVLDEAGAEVPYRVTPGATGTAITPVNDTDKPLVVTAIAHQQAQANLGTDLAGQVQEAVQDEALPVGPLDGKGPVAPTPPNPIGVTAAKPFISIPSTYRYCPDTCKPKARHDYCTWSPDRWGRADFRGPCARHDMAIDTIARKSVSLSEKKSQRRSSDTTFRGHLQTNCRYAYDAGVSLTGCLTASVTYYAAVSAQTAIWDGK